MTNKTFTYNWQELNKKYPESEGFDGFLDFFLLSMLTPGEGGSAVETDVMTGAISDASDGFTNVEVGITINGVEVNAEAWLRHLDDRIESHGQYLAGQILKERFGNVMDAFDKQRDAIDAMMRDARGQMRDTLTAHGVDLGPDEDYYY